MNNHIEVKFKALPENIKLARNITSSFLLEINPTLGFINEVKSIVSEAVTNSIIHGYESDPNKYVDLKLMLNGNNIEIYVEDSGKGIEDVDAARMPMFTSKKDTERSGLGFTIIEVFSDSTEVISKLGEGTLVKCVKELEDVEMDANVG